jgi:hypothetical protein
MADIVGDAAQVQLNFEELRDIEEVGQNSTIMIV